MNLPNLLTLLRIFFVPLLVGLLVQQPLTLHLGHWAVTTDGLALVIFLMAAATDLLDGYLARRWGQVTTVGTLLDPIADKLLISSALIALVQVQQVPAWMAIIIVGREFAVTGLRSIAAAEGYTIQASDLGKSKMVLQVVAVTLLVVSIRRPRWHSLAMWWLWGVVLLALVSAFDYFRKFWHRVDESVKRRRRRELLLLERQRKLEAARSRLASRIARDPEA